MLSVWDFLCLKGLIQKGPLICIIKIYLYLPMGWLLISWCCHGTGFRPLCVHTAVPARESHRLGVALRRPVEELLHDVCQLMRASATPVALACGGFLSAEERWQMSTRQLRPL